MMKFLPIEVEETLKQGRKKDDDLKSAQVMMEEVREENERLKLTISQMMKDYHSLKMNFHDILQQDQLPKSTDSTPITISDDESELVSLRLGRFSGDPKREQNKNNYQSKHQENSLDGSKEEENNAFHKSMKTARSDDDEIILEQNPLKKPRVSVRAVCDTQTMNDGCQWRKYGQKIAKGNPCPRAYYRCTISSSCPVRKQVQRCAENMSILTTTYEGTHNHPLPASATTMASATSAAATMLKCGSSTSSPPGHGVSAASSTRPSLVQFNFPNSSNSLATPCLIPRASISTSQSHPTVILDLTAPNQTSSPYNTSSSTCFNFATSTFHSWDYSNTLQSTWDSKIDKAITRNPTFESALAAAVTSFVGNGGVDHNLDEEGKLGENGKWSKNINFSEASGETIGCYWMNSQQKKLASFSPFSVSASMAPTHVFLPDDGQQIKL